MSHSGHKGAIAFGPPEVEAKILEGWKELHNGVVFPTGYEFQAFRQGYLYSLADAREKQTKKTESAT